MYFTTNARFTIDGTKKGGSASDLMDYDTALANHYAYMSQQIQNEDNYKVMSEIRNYDDANMKVVKREVWTRTIEEETPVEETTDSETAES